MGESLFPDLMDRPAEFEIIDVWIPKTPSALRCLGLSLLAPNPALVVVLELGAVVTAWNRPWLK